MEQATTDEQRISLIRNFPIPNTREDIFEFVILASTNMENENHKLMYNAWESKFGQAYEKAKLLFEKDVEFKEIETMRNKICKIRKKSALKIYLGK